MNPIEDVWLDSAELPWSELKHDKNVADTRSLLGKKFRGVFYFGQVPPGRYRIVAYDLGDRRFVEEISVRTESPQVHELISAR